MGKRKTEMISSYLTRLIILSVVGIPVALYLVYDHWNPQEHSICELGSVVSCSVVNKSSYSELLNVPVAVFGVLWFITLLFMSFKATTAPTHWVPAIFIWCLAGVGFVGYLLYAEFVLHTICPFCTIIHILNLIAMWFAWRIYRAQTAKPGLVEVIGELKAWGVFWALVFLLPVVLFNVQREEMPREALDRCLYEKGAIMYGAPTCGFCQQQKRLLGDDTMEMVKFVDCSAAAGRDVCAAKTVESYPTWTIEKEGVEVKRYAGVLSVAKLFEFYECPGLSTSRPPAT